MHSSHGALRSYQEKQIKGKMFMKGGKTKVEVSHVPKFSPSYTHISRGGLPLLYILIKFLVFIVKD